MKTRSIITYLICALVVIAVTVALYCVYRDDYEAIKDYDKAGRSPRISPDYTSVVIPPNIAPLNFTVKQKGSKYCVRISGEKGKEIEIFSTTGTIAIPMRRWKELLDANRGGELYFDIYVKADSRWTKFERIRNSIAKEPIDPYLVYRKFHASYETFENMGLYQRNLTNYDESVIIHNRSFGHGCTNCHSFHKNSPRSMLFHIRSKYGKGSVLYRDGKVIKLLTDTKFNGAAIYPSWHPNGKILAFSSNKIVQFFHTIGENRDVFDEHSDLLLYLFDTNTVTTSSEISKPERLETYPTWSPDGKYLYFCSGPKLPIEKHAELQYDLMRISYDVESDTWGKAEVVLAAADTGLSIAHPRISPDGRFLMFCMAKYGNFMIYQPSSDLYLLDLKSGEYRKLAINSDQCESYHSFSSNGRWFVFTSKRRDGVLGRPYFSYIDEAGKVYKPILLPQKDGDFYESFIYTYNVPELITERISPGEQAFAQAIHSKDAIQAKLDPRIEPKKDSEEAGSDLPYQSKSADR